MRKKKLILPILLLIVAVMGGCVEEETANDVEALPIEGASTSSEDNMEDESVEDQAEIKTEDVIVTEEPQPTTVEVTESAEVAEEAVAEPTEEPVYETESVVEESTVPEEQTVQNTTTLLGTYKVTWYTPSATYGNIGAMGVALTDGYSVAMPDYTLLGRTVLVEGYGYFRVEDISPSGIVDIFVNYESEIPSYGVDTANVYLVE